MLPIRIASRCADTAASNARSPRMVTFTAVSPHTNKAGGFPIMTLPLGFLMKDVLFLVASFYLLKQDLTRAALEITRS